MNINTFRYREYDTRVDPLKSEIKADIDQLLASDATKKSHNGTIRNDDDRIRDLIRGKIAEVHIRKCDEKYQRISEEVVKSHLQSHPFYARLLQKNGPNSLVNWKYHDIVDVSSGTIIEVKAWVGAKHYTHYSENGISALQKKMVDPRQHFWADIVYIYDFCRETLSYVLAYEFTWNVERRGYKCTMKGEGF